MILPADVVDSAVHFTYSLQLFPNPLGQSCSLSVHYHIFAIAYGAL